MSNKPFFNKFFTKNKLWAQIQNNPIAHQDLWSNWYPGHMFIHLTSRHGAMLNDANAHDFNVRYYPAPANRHRVRIPIGRSINSFRVRKQKMTTHQQAEEYIRRFKRKPALGVALPPPNNAVNTLQNIGAMLSSDRYKVYPMDRYDTDLGWWREDDYWWPDYEGDFMNIKEKSVQKTPAPRYDKDSSLIPKKYMTDKQKEAYIWMIGGNEMYNM